MDSAEFKSTWSSNFFTGVGLVVLSGVFFWLPLYMTEDDFLHTRVRRGGGIIKLIEQTLGWELFSILMFVIGFSVAVMGLVSLWKAINTKPDARVLETHLEFHPAVHRHDLDYQDVSHWSIKFSNGHPVLWLHLLEPYWSLQGLYKRKTIKLEGDKDQLGPIVDFLLRHPIMSLKFVKG